MYSVLMLNTLAAAGILAVVGLVLFGISILWAGLNDMAWRVFARLGHSEDPASEPGDHAGLPSP